MCLCVHVFDTAAHVDFGLFWVVLVWWLHVCVCTVPSARSARPSYVSKTPVNSNHSVHHNNLQNNGMSTEPPASSTGAPTPTPSSASAAGKASVPGRLCVLPLPLLLLLHSSSLQFPICVAFHLVQSGCFAFSFEQLTTVNAFAVQCCILY